MALIHRTASGDQAAIGTTCGVSSIDSSSSQLSFPLPMLAMIILVYIPLSSSCAQTVLRSVMTRTMLPAPAISTNFSCQLNSTLIACPPPSPPPLEPICEKPVACGVNARLEAEDDPEVCDIPLYRYFISTSSVSGPPSLPYIRLSMGDMSDCLMDWRISTTVPRCIS